MIATSTRIAASKRQRRLDAHHDPGAERQHLDVRHLLGDSDMTLMRAYFVKPQSIVAMSFSDDPQLGLVCDRFTGSATARIATQSFVMRTASLR